MRCTRCRLALGLAMLLTLTVADAALARQAVITTTDGKQITGEVVSETDQAITLSVAGIRRTINRSDIKGEVQYLLSPDEEFDQRRAGLQDDDIAGRRKLADWARGKRLLEKAKKELDDLAVRAPDDPEVQTSLRAVVEDIKKRDEEKVPPKPVETQPAVAPPKPVGPVEPANPQQATSLLTPTEVNIIKIYEIDLTAVPRPKVIIPKAVVTAILKDYASATEVPKDRNEQDALYTKASNSDRAWEVLELMFKIKARDLYSQVKVPNDPPSMAYFRDKIYKNYVMSYCGTADCHGGAKAGRFVLISNDAYSTNARYTNFFILHSYQNNDGMMIDRDKPDRSLLIQYGMERKIATLWHPKVGGADIRPAIFKTNNPTYVAMMHWIGDGANDSLFKDRTTYPGVNFTPPGGAATQPATEPAPEGAPAAPPPEVPAPAPPPN